MWGLGAAPAGAARRSKEAALWAGKQDGDSDAELALAAAELEEWDGGESGSDGYSGGEEEEDEESSSADGETEGETECRPRRQRNSRIGSCFWREYPAGSGQLARDISQRMLTTNSCSIPSECQESVGGL
jgi:hypothetical protein